MLASRDGLAKTLLACLLHSESLVKSLPFPKGFPRWWYMSSSNLVQSRLKQMVPGAYHFQFVYSQPIPGAYCG